jgi:hypothetical protein
VRRRVRRDAGRSVDRMAGPGEVARPEQGPQRALLKAVVK